MSWRETPYEDCLLCQTLLRDDGAELGHIIRFYDDGPTYAMTFEERQGPHSSS
jgi:hypothetical protein